MTWLEQLPFTDLAGAQVFANIPISERLINELIARALPPGGVVRQVVVRPDAGNRLEARVTLRAAFMPPLNITADIEQQPVLPGSPMLGLRLSGLGGLMHFAGAAAGLSNVLPPGVRVEGDRVLVDVHVLLQERGAATLIPYIEEFFVATEPGRVILSCRLRVPPA